MSAVTYEIDDSVATIVIDDGKANALSPTLQDEIEASLSQAEGDGVGAIVITGRPGLFSAGFDLATLAAGGADAERMLRGGFLLARRTLALPVPVVVGCTGHAIAMGVFLMCSGDYRIGARGEFRIQANEVAIGLTVPRAAVAILRYRLTPSAFDRAAALAESFTPERGVAAGFMDEVVEPDVVVERAQQFARSALALDQAAHAGTKERTRGALIDEVDRAIEAEFGTG